MATPRDGSQATADHLAGADVTTFTTEELRAMLKHCARYDLNKPLAAAAQALHARGALDWREERDLGHLFR